MSEAGETTLGVDLSRPSDPLEDIAARIAADEHNSVEPELDGRIRDIERAEHRYAADLVRPLLLLGDVYYKQERFNDAIDVYQRAVHVERVSTGLHSPGQIDGLYREANALLRVGDIESANNREENAYEVLARNYERFDLELLPGTLRLAKWYEAVNNVLPARRMYVEALHLYQANGKDYTPEAIPVLQGLASTHRRERFPPYYVGTDAGAVRDTSSPAPGLNLPRGLRSGAPLSFNNFAQGERALRQVIDIVRSQEPEDPQAVSAAVTELADWMLLFNNQRDAEELYTHAYSILQEGGHDAAGVFGRPTLLHFPAPADPRPPSNAENRRPIDGSVTVRFKVSDEGQVRGMKTQSSEPKGLMDFRVRRSLRLARFRPALDSQGSVVPFDEYDFTHRFKYFPKAVVDDPSANSAPDNAQATNDAQPQG